MFSVEEHACAASREQVSAEWQNVVFSSSCRLDLCMVWRLLIAIRAKMVEVAEDEVHYDPLLVGPLDIVQMQPSGNVRIRR
jgi:hypothetical protein